MDVVFRSTFRSFLRASAACGVLVSAVPGHVWAAEATAKSDLLVAAADGVEELVVTGTNIRGGTATGPVAVISREDFDRGGFQDIGQALRSLPVNFGGGINTETFISGTTADAANSNVSGATSPNLRGLGSGATLTLLNGRRLPAGGPGLSVDVSMIPVAAIKRIDVLADGASAIYGADAVAGVVNIITRRDYDGAEARVRYGAADGGLGTYTGSLTAGGKVGAFSGVVGVEYSEQEHLSAAKRERAKAAYLPLDLFPQSNHTSYFASGQYDVSPRIQVYADALYTQRFADFTTSSRTQYSRRNSKVSQYSMSPGITAKIGETWSIDLIGSIAENREKNPSYTIQRTTGVRRDTANDQTNKLRTIDLRGSGNLFSLPAGPVAAAFGAAYRTEDFSSRAKPFIGSDRNVASIYGELTVPIIDQAMGIPMISGLDLSLAGRYDDYSDFGSVGVPKVGLTWRLTPALSATASYSKSFRAPSGFDRGLNYYTALLDTADNTPSGTSRAMLVDGTGGVLNPERSKNLNFTINYRPPQIEGLDLSLSYYRVDYRNRIADPDPSFAIAFDIRGAPAELLTRNPSAVELAALVAGSTSSYAVTGAYDLSKVAVIIDTRNTNIATTHIDGLQGSAKYRRDVGFGSLGVSWDVAYIANFDDRLRSGLPEISRVDTVFSPAAFRSRLGLQVDSGNWSAAAFWNYVGDYVDNRVATAPKKVKPWDTIDASAEYKVPNALVRGARVIVSVTNLLDAKPPQIAPIGGALTSYDGANASVVGRFASIEFVKSW